MAKWTHRIVSYSNIVTGILAILLQVCELILFRTTSTLREPDLVAIGIWGGSFFILFGVLLLSNRLRDSVAIQSLAVYGSLIGLTMIGLYSWSVNRYQDLIQDCDYIYIYNNVKLCGRVALDSLMILSGIVSLFINILIVFMASSLAKN